jgi:hypothetical protein
MSGMLASWEALLTRRPALRDTLAPLTGIVVAWDAWSPATASACPCTSRDAQDLWSNGEPLLAAGPPPLERDRIEPLLERALDIVGRVEDVQPFIDGWNTHVIEPVDLLPAAGRVGSEALERTCLSQDATAFVALAGLRPSLSDWFAAYSALVEGAAWSRGTCPCCGAPPGFADLLEDGRRQLACHFCGTRWIFPRLACPFCDTASSRDIVRLIAEGEDEGYAVAACRACRGYLKEIDRRARWNAGPPIVEDWGAPHLDVIARRQRFWRPPATLVQLAARSA